MARRTARDLIRLALHYAIEEREGWLASIGPRPEGGPGPRQPTPAERAQELVDQWTDMLARKYGERPMSHRAVPGEAVPLTSVINRPPQEFDASAATLPLKL